MLLAVYICATIDYFAAVTSFKNAGSLVYAFLIHE